MIVTSSTQKVIHYPRLDTILMVEEFIKEHSGEFKKRALWENLPKRMMYQTYSVIIEYLIDSGKISVDTRSHICWIWNPNLVRRYMDDDSLTIRDG